MTDGAGAEPNVFFRQFIGESLDHCSKMLVEFVNAAGEEITREQIISISAHELGVHDNDEDGEANRDVELGLYYTDYKEPHFQSLKDLRFTLTKNNADWDVVQNERFQDRQSKDYVFIT